MSNPFASAISPPGSVSQNPQGSGSNQATMPTGLGEHPQQTLDQVKRQLGLSWWESGLLWLCKTDLYVLRAATYETRLQLTGFGLLVVLATVLSFFSMNLALGSTLLKDEPIFLTILVATVYATAILFIEREIVDPAKSGWQSIVLRIVMGFIIATVVSFPVEMKILETRIDQQIRETNKDQNKDKFDDIQKIEGKANARFESARKESNDRLDGLKSKMRILNEDLDREARNIRCLQRCEAKKIELQKLEQEIAAEAASLAVIFDKRISPTEAQDIKRLKDEIDEQARKTTDPLSRLLALNEIGKKHPAASVLSWMLRLFFVTLELMPVLLKMLSPKTEYQFYVDGRRALNEAKINLPINQVITRMQAHPESAWREYRQVLDLIEHGIEDRCTVPSRPLPEILRAMSDSQSIPHWCDQPSDEHAAAPNPPASAQPQQPS